MLFTYMNEDEMRWISYHQTAGMYLGNSNECYTISFIRIFLK
jgi:hypothetical protein